MTATAPLSWHKSSKSESTSCVEIAARPGAVAVRDSKDPDGPWLTFTAADWNTFVASLRAE